MSEAESMLIGALTVPLETTRTKERDRKSERGREHATVEDDMSEAAQPRQATMDLCEPPVRMRTTGAQGRETHRVVMPHQRTSMSSTIWSSRATCRAFSQCAT